MFTTEELESRSMEELHTLYLKHTGVCAPPGDREGLIRDLLRITREQTLPARRKKLSLKKSTAKKLENSKELVDYIDASMDRMRDEILVGVRALLEQSRKHIKPLKPNKILTMSRPTLKKFCDTVNIPYRSNLPLREMRKRAFEFVAKRLMTADKLNEKMLFDLVSQERTS